MKLSEDDIAKIESLLTDYEVETSDKVAKDRGLSVYIVRHLVSSLRTIGVGVAPKPMGRRIGYRKWLRIPQSEANDFAEWRATKEIASRSVG